MIYTRGDSNSAVLCDGTPLDLEEVVARLNQYDAALNELRRLTQDLHLAVHGDHAPGDASLPDLIAAAETLREAVLAAAVKQMGIR